MAYYKEVILMWLLSFFVFTIQALNPVLFFDDFDDKALPGWRISNNVGVFADRGTLFMGRDADILTRDPGSEDWTNYTVIFRFRITEMDELSQFIIDIRSHPGLFNVITSQSVNIFPKNIAVWTIRPKLDRDERPIDRGVIKQPLELKKRYILVIDTLNNNFAIYLDDQKLLSYEDPETPPGYVRLSLGPFGATRVELDYFSVIQGGYFIDSQGKLTTTWGWSKQISK